jgi:hypothetical protein
MFGTDFHRCARQLQLLAIIWFHKEHGPSDEAYLFGSEDPPPSDVWQNYIETEEFTVTVSIIMIGLISVEKHKLTGQQRQEGLRRIVKELGGCVQQFTWDHGDGEVILKDICGRQPVTIAAFHMKFHRLCTGGTLLTEKHALLGLSSNKTAKDPRGWLGWFLGSNHPHSMGLRELNVSYTHFNFKLPALVKNVYRVVMRVLCCNSVRSRSRRGFIEGTNGYVTIRAPLSDNRPEFGSYRSRWAERWRDHRASRRETAYSLV